MFFVFLFRLFALVLLSVDLNCCKLAALPNDLLFLVLSPSLRSGLCYEQYCLVRWLVFSRGVHSSHHSFTQVPFLDSTVCGDSVPGAPGAPFGSCKSEGTMFSVSNHLAVVAEILSEATRLRKGELRSLWGSSTKQAWWRMLYGRDLYVLRSSERTSPSTQDFVLCSLQDSFLVLSLTVLAGIASPEPLYFHSVFVPQTSGKQGFRGCNPRMGLRPSRPSAELLARDPAEQLNMVICWGNKVNNGKIIWEKWKKHKRRK